MNCPRCGEDWSDVAVVRNAKREALAPTPPDALREAAENTLEWLEENAERIDIDLNCDMLAALRGALEETP